jgi:copper(I)-binding protein/predicted DsbA family dithiol-disulfide isomerase
MTARTSTDAREDTTVTARTGNLARPTTAMAVVAALALGLAAPGPRAAVAAGMEPGGMPVATSGPISVHAPWTRASMMMELANAAYMVIRNDGDIDDALVGASSPVAGVAELHRTSRDAEGSMAMAPVAEIPLPAGADTALEPGGYHIMLIDLAAPLADGDVIDVTLEFALAAPLQVPVPVRATGPMSAEASPVATPELTFAPLVTLPPIAAPPVATPVDLADGYALGDPSAPVSIEIWEDFQCPFCQQFSFGVKPLIVERYVAPGSVRLVFRDLPFLGDESHWAAVAASLAADQDLFWPYHDHLFANLRGENVGSYGLDRLLEIGEVVGLDMAAFREGLRLDAARARFAEIQTRARRDAAALGINATPTVVVAGVPLRSPDFDTVSAAIEAALGAREEATPAGSPGDAP